MLSTVFFIVDSTDPFLLVVNLLPDPRFCIIISSCFDVWTLQCHATQSMLAPTSEVDPDRSLLPDVNIRFVFSSTLFLLTYHTFPISYENYSARSPMFLWLSLTPSSHSEFFFCCFFKSEYRRRCHPRCILVHFKQLIFPDISSIRGSSKLQK